MGETIKITAELDTRTGELRLRALDRNLEQTLKQAGRHTDDATRAANKWDREIKNVGTSVGGLAGPLSTITGLVGGAFAVNKVMEFGREADQARLRSEGLRRAFEQIEGSSAGANRSLEYANKVAKELGGNYLVLADSYKGLSAGAKEAGVASDDTRVLFEGLTAASTVLGLKADQTHGAMNAVVQMFSKGTVQAEELRGQLGERLPGAFGMAARAMGVSVSQLNKMLDRGEVLAEDLLPKLGRQLLDEFGDKAREAAQQGQGAVNRLDNSIEKLYQNIGGKLAPSIDKWRNSSADLIDTLNTAIETGSYGAFLNHLFTGYTEPRSLAEAETRLAKMKKMMEEHQEKPWWERGELGPDNRPAWVFNRDLEELENYVAKQRELQRLTASWSLDWGEQGKESIASLAEQEKALAALTKQAGQTAQAWDVMALAAKGEAEIVKQSTAAAKKADEDRTKLAKQNAADRLKFETTLADGIQTQQNEITAKVQERAAATRDLEQSLSTDLAKLTLKGVDLKVWEVEQWQKAELEKARLSDDSARHVQMVNEIAARRIHEAQKSGLQKTLEAWQDTDRLITDGLRSTVDQVSNDLYAFYKKGKMNLEDFAEAYLDIWVRMLLQMAAQYSITGVAGIFEQLLQWAGIINGGGGGGLFNFSGGGGGAAGTAGTAANAISTGKTLYGAGSTIGSWITGTEATNTLLGYGGLAHQAIADSAAGYSGSLWAFNETAGMTAAEVAAASQAGATAATVSGSAGAGLSASGSTSVALGGGAAGADAASTATMLGMNAAMAPMAIAGAVILAGNLLGALTSSDPMTPEEARGNIGSNLDYLERAGQAPSGVGATQESMLDRILIATDKIQDLTDVAYGWNVPIEQLTAGMSDLSAKVAGAAEAYQAAQPFVNDLTASMAEGRVSYDDASEALNRLADYLGLPADAADTLRTKNEALFRSWLGGAISAEDLANRINRNLADAFEGMARDADVSREQIFGLINALDEIPREVTSVITTVHRTVGDSSDTRSALPYSGGGSSSGSTSAAWDGSDIWGVSAPNYHDGLEAGKTTPRLHRGLGAGLKPDEFHATLQLGEAVLEKTAVARGGGPAGVEYYRATGRSIHDRGGDSYQSVVNVGAVFGVNDLKAMIRRETEASMRQVQSQAGSRRLTSRIGR